MKQRGRITNFLAIALPLVIALFVLVMPHAMRVSLAGPDPEVTPIPTPVVHWKTYVDPVYGYSLKYLPTWYIEPPDMEGWGAIARIHSSSSSVLIGVESNEDRLDLKEWLELRDKSSLRRGNVITETEAIKGEKRSIWREMEGSEGRGLAIFLAGVDRVYRMSAWSADTSTKEMLNMILSFLTLPEAEPDLETIVWKSPEEPSEIGSIMTLGKPELKFPFLNKWKISCGYAGQSPGHPNDQYNRHALDFVNDCGAGSYDRPVVAAHSGKIKTLWDDYGGGNTVVLDADGMFDAGYATWYMHLKSFSVANGAWVSQGDEIGKSDCTGVCSDHHIHFALINYDAGRVSEKPEPMCGYMGFSPGQSFDSCQGGTAPILNFTAELYCAPSNNQSADVVIEVCEVGSTNPLFKQTVTTGSNGQYHGLTLSGICPGVYDLYAKPIAPSGYLKKKAGHITLSSGTNTVDFSQGGTSKFTPGDIDVYGQDNEVNALDYSVFIANYATSNPLADFNRDGEVNILDYSILVSHSYGQRGDGEIGGQQSGSQLAMVQDSTLNAYLALIPWGGGTWNVGDEFESDIIVDTGDYATDGTDVIVSYDPRVLEVQDEDSEREGIQVREGTSQGKMYPFYPANYVNTTQGKIYLRGTSETASSPIQTRWGDFGSIRFKALCGVNATDVSIEFIPEFSADTNVAANVNHRDVLVAVEGVRYEIKGTPRCDSAAPTGRIVSPFSGSATNSDLITIEAEANDDFSGVDYVEFHSWYDGNWHHIGDDDTPPYSIDWDCSAIGDQTVWFTIHIWDNEGNEAVDPGGYVDVILDRVEPTGNIVSPAPDSYIHSDQVDIVATASDDRSGVIGLQFFVWYDDGSGYAWHGLPLDWDGSDGWTSVWDTSGIEDQGSIGFWTYIFDHAGNMGAYNHGGITLDRVPPCVLLGDFTCDCDVDIQDIQQVASHWRCKCEDACYDPLYDMDSDCDIDVVDIMLVVKHWGETCP